MTTKKTKNVPVYEMLWRNKFLTLDAESIDDMIATYESVLSSFKAMKAAGVTLDPQGGTGDDYARLVTTDPLVAKEFGLEVEEMDDEDELEDGEWSTDEEPMDETVEASDAAPKRGFEFI